MFRGSVHFPEYWLRRNGLQGMDFKAWSLLLGRSFDPNFCPNLRWNFTQGCVLKLWIDRHISRDKVYMPWIKSNAFIHAKKKSSWWAQRRQKKKNLISSERVYSMFPCICSVIDHRSNRSHRSHRSDRSHRSQITQITFLVKQNCDVFCDLLLNWPIPTWNFCVLHNKEKSC